MSSKEQLEEIRVTVEELESQLDIALADLAKIPCSESCEPIWPLANIALAGVRALVMEMERTST